MTPQLMQAIKLLQLSSLDLAAYVEAELEKNPLLERADPAPGEESAEGSSPSQSSEDGTPSDDASGNESERNETIRADSDEPPEGFSGDGDADLLPGIYVRIAIVGKSSGGSSLSARMVSFRSLSLPLASSLGVPSSLLCDGLEPSADSSPGAGSARSSSGFFSSSAST